jgi:hypothetical protein
MAQEKDNGEPSPKIQRPVVRREGLTAYRDKRQGQECRSRTLETRWSMIRFLVFASTVCTVALLRHNTLWAALAGAAGTTLFAGAVWQHVKWENRRTFLLIATHEELLA